MSPSTVISTRRRQLVDERAEQPPEALGERQERPQVVVGLGGGEVDGERHELAGQGQLHHVGDRVAGLVLRLAGARPEVRRDDDGVELEQRRLGRRLGVEHVERGAGDDALAHGVGERRLVDDAAAGDVDHAQRRLGLEQQVATDQARRLGRLRQVDGEEVGLGDDLVERQQLDAELAGPVGRHERVVGDEAHPEAAGPVGDELADAAEAGDAERLVGQLDALPAAALPAPGDERGVGLGDVAGLGQQQRHGVLGGRDDVALRGVDDHHAAARGRLDVDVVEADPGPADDEQVGAGGEHLVGDRRRRADDQGVGADDGVEQLVGGQPGAHVDLVAGGAQAVQPAVGDLFGDQDARHRPTCLPPPPDRLQRVERNANRPSLPSECPTRSSRSEHSVGTNTRMGRTGYGRGRGGGRRARRHRAVVRRPGAAPLRRAPRHGHGDLGPGAAAARRRPTSCSGSTPSTCAELEPRHEPRRRRASSSLGAVVTWVVANRAARPPAGSSGRTRIGAAELAVFIVVPAVPSLVVGQWGDALQTVVDGRRHPRRALGASPATASSPLMRWAWQRTLAAAAAAVQRARPGPAAAAAVHDVPVHQRRGLAGGRHADRRRVRRRARHLLPPRRGVRALPDPGADARAEPLRLVGARSTSSPPARRPIGVLDDLRPTADGDPHRRPPDDAPARQHRPASRSSPRPSRSRSSASASPAFFVALRVPRHPRGDGGGVDRRSTTSTCWPTGRVGGRDARRHRAAASASPRFLGAFSGDVLHRPAVDRRARTARSSLTTSPRSCAKLSPCAASTGPRAGRRRRERAVTSDARHPACSTTPPRCAA